MKKSVCIVLALVLPCVFGLSGCQTKEKKDVVTVGIIDGPDTAEWDAAKKVALKKYNLNIKLVMFSDYTLPNEALNNGEIDANAFQHVPYLDAQIKSRGYKNIVAVAKTFLYPMAMYSNKITKLSEIKAGDKIAVPNDPSNESRALLLLQKSGLITLKKGVGVNATVVDIVKRNPADLKIIELPGAQLPRSLSDVTAAIINNDFAQPAGLNPNKAIVVESADSPYMNVIAVRKQNQNDKKIQEMIRSFQTPEVKSLTYRISDGNAVAGW